MVNIELRRGKERGDRDIFVDGVLWGFVDMHCGGGGQGSTYSFRDTGYTTMEKKVRSLAKRKTWRNDGDERPTEQRLLDAVRELVESGELRHPDELKREHAEASAKLEAHREKWRKQQRARDVKTATELVRRHAHGLQIIEGSVGFDDLRDDIAAALRKARSLDDY